MSGAYGDVELVGVEVIPDVGGLDDHFLAVNGARGEGQFEACAACALRAAAGRVEGCEAVTEI
jgi:hypothetical protein